MLDDIPQIDEIDIVLDDLSSPTSLEVFEALLPFEDEMSTAAIGAIALTGGGGGPPSGAAGGVLGGTYPNPGFAADMATQAELDAHVNDATAAHAATAVAFTPAGTVAATTVQAAIEEVAAEAGGGTPAILMASITLTSAQILDLHNTPVEIFPAPGGRFYYVISYYVAHYRFVTTPYVADFSSDKMLFQYDPGAAPLCLIGNGGSGGYFDAKLLLQQTADAYVYQPVPLAVGDVTFPPDNIAWPAVEIEDKAVTVRNMGDAYEDGDGTLTLRVFYSLIDGA